MKDLLFFLRLAARQRLGWFLGGALLAFTTLFAGTALLGLSGWFISAAALAGLAGTGAAFNLFVRSEEHTSELQSRENLVCRLLLEKKTLQVIHPLQRW